MLAQQAWLISNQAEVDAFLSCDVGVVSIRVCGLVACDEVIFRISTCCPIEEHGKISECTVGARWRYEAVLSCESEVKFEVVVLAIDSVLRRTVEVANRRDTVLLDHCILIDHNLRSEVRHGRKVLGEEDLPVPVGDVRRETAISSFSIVFEMIRDHCWVDFHIPGHVPVLRSDRVESRSRRGRQVNWTLLARSLVSGQTQAIVPIGTVLRVVQGVAEGDSSYKRADNVGVHN